MPKVVLDAATLAKLGGLREEVELYDEAGNRVGVCRPAGPSGGFTDAEIRAAFAAYDPAAPGITTAELLAKARGQ